MRTYIRTETRAVTWSAEGVENTASIEVTPAPELRAHVAVLRIGSGLFAEPVEERVLPDGAVHIIFDLGAGASATVVGATASPALIQLRGRHEHAGVQLLPGGIRAVLGVPAGVLEGMQVPLGALWGADAEALFEQLSTASIAARPRVIEAAIIARLRRTDVGCDRRAAAAVQRVLAARGTLRVRELCAALGVSARRLEQIFEQDVGLSAKTLSRITRFRYSVDYLLEHPECTWSELAYACGFSDQSHLIHEFRALSGATPGALGAT